MKTGSVLLGIVGGLAAGAILGVLYAPDKGCNTRKKVADKSGDLKDKLKGSFNDLVSNVEDKYKDLASNVEDKYKDLASKGSSMVDNATDNLEKMNKEFKR